MRVTRCPGLFLLVVALGCSGSSRAIREGEPPPECRPQEVTSEAARPPAFAHPPTLIRNAVVMTAAGDIYPDGYVYFDEGRIVAVGEGSFEPPSRDLQVIDATGRYLTPGLIDPHSHLGVYPTPYVEAHQDGNEATSPVTAQVSARHSIWPQDPGFMRAVAGGVTTLHVLPGSANLIGGRSVTLKLHRGARVADDLLFPGAPEGLKMACGENPIMVYGGRDSAPSTRMGSIAMLRQAWVQADSYRRQWDRYRQRLESWCDEPGEEQPEPPQRDLGLETLVGVLEGTILPHIHCYRADEMLVEIQLADEFGYQIRSFEHAVEAYKIRDVLARRGITSNVWADWWGFKIEAYDAIEENAGLLTEAGARVSLHSDSPVAIQRLNQEAAKAYFAALDAGIALTEDDALRWITANPAWTLGIDQQTGSIQVGKMADLVLWSAHPFSVYATADLVFVDGVLEYDRANPPEPWSDFEVGVWPEGGSRE